MMPSDALLAVTYRCDGRCAMCHIWQQRSGDELPSSAYRSIPPTLRHVNISGGEPFLREDLPEVVACVKRAAPKAALVISTNGLQPHRIEKAMQEILRHDQRIGVAISLDGIGEVHDRIRGVAGAYERVSETLARLKGMGLTNLRLAFTASEENAGELWKVYELSRKLEAEFTCAVAHGSPIYFRVPRGKFRIPMDLLREQLNRVIAAELHTFSIKRWGRAYFMDGLLAFAAGERRPLPCHAAEEFFFMAPNGEIYPCNILPHPLGNLAKEPFERIWGSATAELARCAVASCRENCWMICTARMAMLRHPARVLAWALRRKLFPPREYLATAPSLDGKS